MRPTTERVREAVFSMLGDVAGVRVLDVFCGSGALGIEALSRGAEEATFVDTRTALVRENLEALGLADTAAVARKDALRWLRGASPESFDLVLCDPPYDLPRAKAEQLDPLVCAVVAPGGRVIAESSARSPLALGLELDRERRYGETLVRLYRRPA